jgi:hypothetical protein
MINMVKEKAGESALSKPLLDFILKTVLPTNDFKLVDISSLELMTNKVFPQ